MDDDRQIIRIAVPSDEPGGLDAARSGRFSRSPCFTIVDVAGDAVVDVRVARNDARRGDHGLTPVLTLGENLVDVVVVAGIAHSTLLHCLQAGIRVFNGEDRPDVRSVVEAFIEEELAPAGSDSMSLH